MAFVGRGQVATQCTLAPWTSSEYAAELLTPKSEPSFATAMSVMLPDAASMQSKSPIRFGAAPTFRGSMV